MARTAHADITTPPTPTLLVALELSKTTWKLGFTTSRLNKARIRDVKAGDLSGFLSEVGAAKTPREPSCLKIVSLQLIHQTPAMRSSS